MPRPRKPPGYEKWSWKEINAGRKMSKSEKRTRRAMVSLGAKERRNGSMEHSWESAFFGGIMAAVLVVGGLLVECSKQ